MGNPQRRRVYHPTKSPFASAKAVTQKHLANEADINTIVARAKKGIVPANMRDRGVFADLTNIPQDLTEAFARVESAWDLFEQLPAKAREELGNDPRRLAQAKPDFFVRHGLTKPQPKAPESTQGTPGGAGEGSPASPSKKGSKAPKAQSPDPDDQE